MADDFSFGDLAGFLSGGPGGDISGGSEIAAPNIPSGSVIQGYQGSGLDFGDIAQGAKDVGAGVKAGAEAVGQGIHGVLDPVASIAKPLLPLAGLATAGMGISSGIQGAKTAAQQARLQRQAQQMQQQSASATQAAAAPLTQFGEQQLQAAQQGQIPAAIKAKIDEWKTGYLAAIKDRLARQGQGDSQAMMQWVQWVEQQAKAMEATYLQQEQELGLRGLTQGAQTLASAGGQSGALAAGAGQQQGGIDALMHQANEILARVNSSAA